MDLSFNFGSFDTTTVKVEAISIKGRDFLSQMFGIGAVSIELPKSKAEDFAIFASQKGFTY
jgi:hypothetical protein